MSLGAYPSAPAARTRWIVARRGARNAVTAKRPYAFISELERTEEGKIARASTMFLTNRECPWKCVMCDLWRNTTRESIPEGAICEQIGYALERLPAAEILKLYNSGSFFDSGAIRRSEWRGIAEVASRFKHVIVESHPRLIGPDVLEFAGLLRGTLEIAMGLETCHPAALEALNKRITVEHFTGAAKFLRANGISVRTFLLVNAPFIPAREQPLWLERSMGHAFGTGANVVSLIPARGGNGAVEALDGFEEPSLRAVEEGLDFGIRLQKNAGDRVFGDTWDLERFSTCSACFEKRRERIERMNLSQTAEPREKCSACGE